MQQPESTAIQFGPLSIDPVDLGIQGNAVLGIKDSGKTYTATLFAERLFDAGIPFIAFDPIGIWRFLRVPGKGRGRPIVVAGGEDGDLPLTPASAPAIVEAAMHEGISLVLDLFSMELSKADWRRIVMTSVNLLLTKNRAHGLRHVFLEEAAEMVPQKIEDGHVFSAVEKLVRMGGNSRLGCTLINPRAEEVNKAVLELCDNLFLHRQKGKNSLISLRKWLDYAAVDDAKAITDTLSTLPTGECWAWLRESARPVLVKVPEKDSYHPDRRSMRGDIAVLKAKAVDVEGFVSALRVSIPKVEAEIQANDPKVLKARIADLQGQLKAKPPAAKAEVDSAAIAAAEQRGFDRGRDEGYREAKSVEGRRAAHNQAVRIIEAIGGAAMINGDGDAILAAVERMKAIRIDGETPGPPHTAQADTPTAAHPPAPRRRRTPEAGTDKLPGAAGKLLSVIDTSPPVLRTWGQFAALAGLKARGGHFLTGKRHLLDSGLVIEEGSKVRIATPSAGAAKPSLDPAANVRMWKGVLSACAPQILQYLFDHGGEASTDEVARGLGLQPRGGHWLTGWKQLRDNDIVSVSGGVATLTELFRPMP